MKYTTSYHLPQWDETDRVLRTDFNQMCSDIETGLKKTAADAANAASSADAHAADAAAAAAAAHAAANAAQATANAAYCPTNLPYVIGTYTGTNAELTVTLGFRPSFLIICRPDADNSYMSLLAAGRDVDSKWLSFTARGFTVYKNNPGTSGTAAPPVINSGNVKYVYIAFR